jgi:hypothetical protein
MDRAPGFPHDDHDPVAGTGDDQPLMFVTGAAREIVFILPGDPAQDGQVSLPPQEQPDSASFREQTRVGLFQDIPRSIWTTFLAGWAGFFLLMWLFFAVDASSTFMVSVAVLFGLMAFGLPIVMAKQSNCPNCPPIEVVHTHTGPVSVRAAAAQIAMIPIAVFIGFLGFILFAK